MNRGLGKGLPVGWNPLAAFGLAVTPPIAVIFDDGRFGPSPSNHENVALEFIRGGTPNRQPTIGVGGYERVAQAKFDVREHHGDCLGGVVECS